MLLGEGKILDTLQQLYLILFVHVCLVLDHPPLVTQSSINILVIDPVQSSSSIKVHIKRIYEFLLCTAVYFAYFSPTGHFIAPFSGNSIIYLDDLFM